MTKRDDEIDAATQEIMRLAQMPDDERDAYFQALPPDGTSTKLVADLMTKPACGYRGIILARAEAFYYDDFKSTYEGACPKMKLVEDLNVAGYHDLAQKAIDGEYD